MTKKTNDPELLGDVLARVWAKQAEKAAKQQQAPKPKESKR